MNEYKVVITNELTGQEFAPQKASVEDLNDFIEYQKGKKKCPYGKLERWVRTESLSEELASRVIDTRVVQVETSVIDEETQEESVVMVDVEESLVKQDFVVSEPELVYSYAELRAKEYAQIDALLSEALVEKELGDDTKWQEYLALRADIKARNPKA